MVVNSANLVEECLKMMTAMTKSSLTGLGLSSDRVQA